MIHGQMSIFDVLPSNGPTVRVTVGPEDRPREWIVSYPDGRSVTVRRTADPAMWFAYSGENRMRPVQAYSLPYPSISDTSD